MEGFGKRLVDRGYIVMGESDIEGISDHASVHEMAAIYQKLGPKICPEAAEIARMFRFESDSYLNIYLNAEYFSQITSRPSRSTLARIYLGIEEKGVLRKPRTINSILIRDNYDRVRD